MRQLSAMLASTAARLMCTRVLHCRAPWIWITEYSPCVRTALRRACLRPFSSLHSRKEGVHCEVFAACCGFFSQCWCCLRS